MSDKSPPSTNSDDEIEISLANGAELVLQSVEIDAEERPIEFTVSGKIKDVDKNVLAEFQGTEFEPVAIRFRLINNSE